MHAVDRFKNIREKEQPVFVRVRFGLLTPLMRDNTGFYQLDICLVELSVSVFVLS